MKVNIYRLCAKNHNLMITLKLLSVISYSETELLISKNITQIFDKFSRNARNGD